MNLLKLSAGVLALLAGSCPAHSISVTDENEDSTPYGVDCSFPIHYKVRQSTRRNQPRPFSYILFAIFHHFF
jgi:hypothetical protein